MFFYVSGGILALVVAFHLGATNAQGQSGNIAAGGFYDPDHRRWVIVATNGDTYTGSTNSDIIQFSFAGNAFGGSPIPTKVETWGRIKADRR